MISVALSRLPEDIPTGLVLSSALGFCIVLLYAVNEFSRPSEASDKFHATVNASLSDLTRRRNFLIAFSLYVLGLVSAFIVLSVVGKSVFPVIHSSLSGISTEAIPLVAAFMLVGLFPNLPFFSIPERWFRAFMHRRADVPHAVELVRDELRRRDFDFTSLPEASAQAMFAHVEEGKAHALLLGELASERLSATSRNWLLVSAIFASIPRWKGSQIARKNLGLSFLDKYKRDFSILELEFRDIREKVYKGNAANHVDRLNASTEKLGKPIGDLLDSLYIFLSCIVVSRPENVDVDDAMETLNFKSSQTAEETATVQRERDALVVASAVAVLLSFCFFAATVPLTSLFAVVPPKDGDYARGLASWLLTDIARYPLAALAGYYLRGRFLRSNQIRLRPTQYACIFALCLLIGLVICLGARAINIYVIWSNCLTVESCPIGGFVMPIQTFFAQFKDRYLLTPIVLALIGLATCFLLDRIRRQDTRIPLSIFGIVATLLSFNVIIAGSVYTSADLLDAVVFVVSSGIFHLAFFTTLAAYLLPDQAWNLIGGMRAHAARAGSAAP